MGFLETIFTYIKSIMFLELLKQLLFNKFLKKLFAFVVAITILRKHQVNTIYQSKQIQKNNQKI